ncbi:group III truncated hemoglobin [Gelidibacter salicanalis]|uniref:Group III truncated hemoglobin n=1 Tax=Gelidibacter salicanalis TaxID=291193 RepID=A0A934KV63_9FLAO|nr:group III truncated hemoglobin [Gelidibacter salicanalis]MBJ7879985.1 group III truncated hemoglobin [Gelidibacter salicanalis]
MEKKDIGSREDVFLLVSEFYKKVRQDKVLGPFFNRIIKDWEAHIERLTTFWESSLFMSRKLEQRYHGNPLEVHIKVDKENDNAITQEHFGLWLNLWFETLDELFEGEYTQNAKNRARKMGTFMFMNIFQARQQ